MSDESLSLHLDSEALARLDAEAAANGYTREAFAARLVEEGLRMARHHGIFFNPGPTGRRAVVRGGPDVWEMMRAYKELEKTSEAFKRKFWKGLRLSEYDVQVAVKYYKEYPQEIDDRIKLDEEAAREVEAHAFADGKIVNLR